MRELWLRQIRGVMRLELRRTLLSGRAIPVYLLAMFPVAMMSLFFVVAMIAGDLPPLQEGVLIYAGVYQSILRGFLYLGAVWTFMNLFRGEVLDRSLHYYFLAPIRREVLAVGKFVAGWASTSILFVASAVLSLVIFFASFGTSAFSNYVLGGPGFGQLLSYVGVTLLACLGYGAVFLVVGLFFRNPIIPAVIIWFWEFLNPFMPALLKKVSVIFYLDSLLPVALPPSPFSVVAEPVPAWLAVPGFLLFTAATLVVAGLRIRHMEIAYTAD
jgi:ABC-type transport system involved in multi-copper enzyme maturation permease subunit